MIPIRPEASLVSVTGLAFEARIAARSGVRVVCSGDAAELAFRLREEVLRGTAGIISFGVSGGLEADLPPGAWLVARTIIHGDQRYETDRGWTESLLGLLPGARAVDFAGVRQPLVDATEKQAMRERTGASAVDMESHVAAAIAAEYGVPFAAFRVVIDPLQRTLPPAALIGVKANGRADVRAVMRSLRAAPAQLPNLIRVAADARAARSSLIRGIRRLGPAMGFPGSPPLQAAEPVDPVREVAVRAGVADPRVVGLYGFLGLAGL